MSRGDSAYGDSMQARHLPNSTIYRFHEGTITIPPTLTVSDRSIQILAAPDADGFGVTISRDSLRPGEDFVQYVARQLAELRARVPRFILKAEGNRILAGHHAATLHYTWGSDQETMGQQQAFVIDRQRVIIITGTAKDAMSERRDEEFGAILDSLRFSA